MDKKKVMGIVITVILTLNAIFAGVMCCRQYMDSKRSEENFNELQDMIVETIPEASDKNDITDETESTDEVEDDFLASYEKYQNLYEENNDFVGWIQIEGTKVNYPVMQSPQNPDFYLKHSFDKSYSDYGVPYADEACAVDQSNNITIYGHNMKNGSMFSGIVNYADEEFYKEHPIIKFDTLHGYGEYEVIAAFRFNTNYETFRYNEFHDMDEQQFNEFIENCEDRRIYDTGKAAKFGDDLITLSTCEYSHENGRFVVVARKIVG